MPTEETVSKAKAAAKPKKSASASAEKPASASPRSKTARSQGEAGEKKAASTSRTRKAKGLDAETRHKLISQTAHFIAERRSQGGDELGDWLFAERLVDEISAAMR